MAIFTDRWLLLCQLRSPSTRRHTAIFTQTLILFSFSKLKDKSQQTWTDFENDLEEFELKTSTAYRLEKSDLVKTANNKRQPLGHAIIPDKVKSVVYVCCHFGHCQLKATGQRKCRRYVSIPSFLWWRRNYEYRWYIISNHVLWYVRQNG